MNRATTSVLTAAGLALAAGCASTEADPTADSSASSAPSSPPSSASSTPTPTEPEGFELTKQRVKMRIRETSKECYGSGVGCNVEYEVKPAINSPLWSEGDSLMSAYDIKYRVVGSENGPSVNTITLNEDGTYSMPGGNMVQTPSKQTKLKVKVVSVTEVGAW